MAEVKKVKKQGKGLSPQTKRTLGNVFKSLISNQSCIDGAKESPWWIAVIFLVLSIFLPVIPITVNYSKTFGASFITNANYGADKGLANTAKSLHDSGYEFKVSEGLLSFYKDGSIYATTEDFIASDIDINTNQYNFLVYATTYSGSELTAFVNNINATKFISGSLEKVNPNGSYPEDTKYYKPGVIILSTNTLAVALYKADSTDLVATSYSGLDWTHTAEGDILARVLDVDFELTNQKWTKAVFEKWHGIFNETYLNAKTKTMWLTSLIYLGVYAALVVFLGLLVFILTRGKTNPFKILSFFTCQKIAWWSAFTPSVLGMILAFIFGTNMIGQMGFIVLFSLRIMWLSMRQLRPM